MDDEIDEDNDIVGHKSVTRKTDSNRKCFWKETIESQDDDDEVIRSYIDVFEQDEITTMKHGCILALGCWCRCGCECGCGTLLKKVGAGAAGLND